MTDDETATDKGEDEGMNDKEAAIAFDRLRGQFAMRKLDPVPAIYPAMIEAMKAIGAIGKDSENTQQQYMFRSVDAFYNAAQPACSAAGIFILPEYEEIAWTEVVAGSKRIYFARLRGKIHFVSAVDGSRVTATMIGEARDYADKATNKAMSAVLKYALMQVFLVPTKDVLDADADNITVETKEPVPETRDQAKQSLACLVTQLRSGATSDLQDGEFLRGIGEDLFPGVDGHDMTTEQIWTIREALRNGKYDLDTGDKIPDTTETKEMEDA